MAADSATFQYKADPDAQGVSDRLRGVGRWDPNRAGLALLYEYRDGRRVVVDGHQRLALARRLVSEGQKIGAAGAHPARGGRDHAP